MSKLGRVVLFGLIIVLGVMIVPIDVANAQQSTLEQTIKPIECVYTSTETGSGTVQDSTCEGQPVPTVTGIAINGGRPVLWGELEATRTIMLRIWISGQWYTYGTDARVTTTGDTWKLDLSGLSRPLAAGVYTVAIEVETSDGLLLRNTNAATFEVEDVLALPPSLIPVPVNFTAPFFTRLIIPQTQEAVPRADLPVPIPPIADDLIKDESADVPLAVRKPELTTVWVILVVLTLAVGVVYYYFRHKL